MLTSGAGAAPVNAGGASGAADLPPTFTGVSGIRLGGNACLPISLPVSKAGLVDCSVVEARKAPCDCTSPGHQIPSDSLMAAVRTQLLADGFCASAAECAAFCGCDLQQPAGAATEPGSARYSCQNDLEPPAEVAGFCLIDLELPASPLGNPALVADCPAGGRRRLRVVGAGIPIVGSVPFLVCPTP